MDTVSLIAVDVKKITLKSFIKIKYFFFLTAAQEKPRTCNLFNEKHHTPKIQLTSLTFINFKLHTMKHYGLKKQKEQNNLKTI